MLNENWTPESWLKHQMSYDLWKIEKNKEKLNVRPLKAA
jgi:plasmid maintenance system antidote protein VapI